MIKLFEDYYYNSKEFNEMTNNQKYWLVATDERLEPSLTKLNCPEEFITGVEIGSQQNGLKYVFVCQYEVKPNDEDNGYEYRWQYNRYKGVEKDSHFEPVATYAGRIDIPDYELYSEKYNL
jgi:hypothetical protein